MIQSMLKLNTKKWVSGAIVIWAFVIFILCVLPGEDIPNPSWNVPYLDKFVHFGMFFLLTWLIALSTAWHPFMTMKRTYGITILVALLYGGLIEIMQHYIFNREGDLKDLWADVIGAVVGCFCYFWVRRIWSKRN